MRGVCLLSLAFLCLGCLLPGLTSSAGKQEPPAQQPHRSPIDIALVGAGRLALTANHTANSISLVDLELGKVLSEKSCGRKPAAVAISPDGRRAAISNLWSASVTLLTIQNQALDSLREVRVGALPRGLLFAPDGQSLFVALSGQDELIRLEWATGKVFQRWPAPREPRHLALSTDGKWLAAGSTRSAQVRCWNLETGQLHWEREIGDAFNLRGLSFTPEGDAVLCAHVVRRDFPVTKKNIEEGWVIDSRLTRLAVRGDAQPALWQIALDSFGQAVGDPHGLALAGSGRWLAVTGSGTQELLLLETAAIPWNSGDPGDFLDSRLQKGDKLRRLPLGGRPLSLTFAPRSNLAAVANYLLDAVQLVDVAAGKIVRTIPLGSPKEPGPARQGEVLFHDARRSHHQWFSCHTCHVEGHTCGLNFDTLNDDSYGTPKLTPSLHQVTHTGPWTWHGQQKNLGAGVVKSFTRTLFGPAPTAAETAAVLAFLETLTAPPNPRRNEQGELSPASRRGQSLFRGKAGCSRCHHEPYYTSPRVYDVKLDAPGSPYQLFNPPSLLGLFARGPYLHDGRASTLEEVLRTHHTPELLGGEGLTEVERSDLSAFLLSL